MMQKIKLLFAASLVTAGLGAALLGPSVQAVNVFNNACGQGTSNTTVCRGSNEDARQFVNPIVNTLLFVIGAVSVIVIIVGGIMYTVSAGDPGRAKKAKDTVLYAVVGLVIALSAYGIVYFVVSQF